MKKIFSFLFLASVATAMFAQGEKTLFERISKIEKKQDWFNLYLNMHTGFDAKFNFDNKPGFNNGAFTMQQFRIEATGNVTRWLSYRWRQRLNRGNEGGGMIDNLPRSIDYAAIGVKFNKHFSIFAGKQGVAYGGFEYDLNPIDIYQYSEMIEYMSNFMTGLTLIYDINSNHQLQLQALNSLNEDTKATYGKNITPSRLPLVYTLNWNGTMGIYQTRWSASVMNEAKDKYMFYFALGNQFNFSKKCNMYLDLMSSTEQLDRKGIITSMCGKQDAFNGHNAFNAMYNSIVTKVNYRFLPKWNLFVQGMFETASVYKDYGSLKKGNYRTSIGYQGGVEYYPMESNLHFFLAFMGQTHLFTDMAKAYGNNNYSTQKLSLGFIYKLPVF